MALLSIQLEQLTPQQLLARCDQWSTIPLPGYFIDFTTTYNTHFYTQIQSVKPMPGQAGPLLIELAPIKGTPDFQIQQAELLSQEGFFSTLQATHYHVPFQIGQTTLDLAESGHVVLIQPNEWGAHRDILAQFVQAQFPVVILDPVGVSLTGVEARSIAFGQQAAFGIQEIGASTFIKWVVQALPEALQKEATELLTQLMPATPDFIPLSFFANHTLIQDHPAKSLILHRLFELHQHGLIANTPEQVLQLKNLSECLYINFSKLPPLFLSLVYEGLFRLGLTQSLPYDTQFFLIAPEVATTDTQQFIQQSNHRVFLITHHPEHWQNHIEERWVLSLQMGQAGLLIQGPITHQFPLFVGGTETDTLVYVPPAQPIAQAPQAIENIHSEASHFYERVLDTVQAVQENHEAPTEVESNWSMGTLSQEISETPLETDVSDSSHQADLSLHQEEPSKPPPMPSQSVGMPDMFAGTYLSTQTEISLSQTASYSSNHELMSTVPLQAEIPNVPTLGNSTSSEDKNLDLQSLMALAEQTLPLDETSDEWEEQDTSLLPNSDLMSLVQEVEQDPFQPSTESEADNLTGMISSAEEEGSLTFPSIEAMALSALTLDEDVMTLEWESPTLEAAESLPNASETESDWSTEISPHATSAFIDTPQVSPPLPNLPSLEEKETEQAEIHPVESLEQTDNLDALAYLQDMMAGENSSDVPSEPESVDWGLEDYAEEGPNLNLNWEEEAIPLGGTVIETDELPPTPALVEASLQSSTMSSEQPHLTPIPASDSSEDEPWGALPTLDEDPAEQESDWSLPPVDPLTPETETLALPFSTLPAEPDEWDSEDELNIDFEAHSSVSTQPDSLSKSKSETEDINHEALLALSTEYSTHASPAEIDSSEDNLDFNLDFDFELPLPDNLEQPVQQFESDFTLPDEDILIESPLIEEVPPLPVQGIAIQHAKREKRMAHYEPGEQVFHQQYGAGVIKRVIAMENDQVILNITFDSVGKRLLDPNLSPLEKVS